MKIFSRFWIFLLICIGLIGCSLVPNELKIAEQLIETAPDSAIHILQRLSPSKYKSNENRALYGLLLIEALDKKHLPLKPDSLLDFSTAYYEQQKDNERLATCYFYKARQYKNNFLYEKAIVSYLKVLDILKPDRQNFYILGKTNSDLGQIYFTQGDFILSRKKYTTAYQNFQNGKFKPEAFYSLIDIGRTYSQTNSFNISRKCFNKVIVETNDSAIIASAFQEIGLNFIKIKQYDSAVFYLKKIIQYPYIKNNRAIRYFLVANAYFELHNIDSAFYFASNSFKYEPDIRTQRECYRILTNSEYLRGNMKSMSAYMNKYVQLGDSIRKVDAQTKGSYIESMHDKTVEIAKTKNWLWYLLLLIFSGAVIAYYTFKKIRHQSKKEIEKKDEDHLQQKADSHKEALLKHRNALLHKIEDKKGAQSAKWKKATPDERKTIYIDIYKEVIHFNNTALFNKEMDIQLNNLATKLQTNYPELNQTEIQWCCLHLLDIPANDIMMLLDYNVESLKKMKQRLAKRVNIHYVSQIDDFLYTLFIE